MLWALLLFFVYDSLFAFIGAVAADTRQAQVLESPCVSIFMLFNGVFVTKADAPAPVRWIFDISPNAYAMEAIAVKMSKRPSAGFQGAIMLQEFGFTEEGGVKGMEVLVSMIVLLRVGQMLGLKYLNHVKR
jgi:ABC-type Na+ efflux pump permease subunit